MIVDVGKNKIRDWISDKVVKAGLGLNGADVSASDTGLNNNADLGTAGTIKDLTTSLTDKQFQKDYFLGSLEGNNNTYKEWGMHDNSTLFNRIAFYDLGKSDTEEWSISCVIKVI